jgi:hypothetical protein
MLCSQACYNAELHCRKQLYLLGGEFEFSSICAASMLAPASQHTA